MALKNSVYILPLSEATIEDFRWIRREILKGGEATVVRAELVDGLSDSEVEALFQAERDAEYAEVTARAEHLARGVRGRPSEQRRQELEIELSRLERRLSEIAALDHFGASGREAAAAALRALRERALPAASRVVAVAMITPEPVVITVAFIGFLVAGLAGASVAALATFVPCWLFTVLPAPYFRKFAKHAGIKAFVDGVTAAATGAIAAAAFVLGRRAVVDLPSHWAPSRSLPNTRRCRSRW